MKTPTWGEVEEFCRLDGWKPVRQTKHVFFQKVLADGTVLETHRSFGKAKTMSAGRFKAILRDQLRPNEKEFWEVLRTGEPATRPATLPGTPVTHPAYVVRVLTKELGKSEEEIGRLSPEAARRLVEEFWGRPRK